MPRRRKSQAVKRDWRWYTNMGLNVFVALSMVLGTIVLFTGGSLAPRAALPTVADLPIADIPTLAPTVGAPLATVAPPSAIPVATPATSPTARP